MLLGLTQSMTNVEEHSLFSFLEAKSVMYLE